MSGPRPVVTALVPTRNRAHSLSRALDSIHAQEGRGERFDLEVVVVDDGSTDATGDVVRRYGDVHYLRRPEWRGISATCNEGLRASRGEFIALLDDDDTWLPHKLRVQVPLLEAHPEVGVVYGQSLVRRGGAEYLFPPAMGAPSGWVFEAMLLSNFCGHHASCLIRRAALARAGEFDESLGIYEDLDLSLRLAFHVPFLFAPGAVDVYNMAAQGLWMRTLASRATFDDGARVIDKALALLPDSPRYAALRRLARHRMVRNTARATPVPPWALPRHLCDVRARMRATLRASPSSNGGALRRRIEDHRIVGGLLVGEVVRVLAQAFGYRAYARCSRAWRGLTSRLRASASAANGAVQPTRAPWARIISSVTRLKSGK